MSHYIFCKRNYFHSSTYLLQNHLGGWLGYPSLSRLPLLLNLFRSPFHHLHLVGEELPICFPQPPSLFKIKSCDHTLKDRETWAFEVWLMFESLAAVILKSLHAPCLQKFPPSSKFTSWEQSFEVSHFREEAVETRLVFCPPLFQGHRAVCML